MTDTQVVSKDVSYDSTNNNAVVTQTTKTTYTKEDLLARKNAIQYQKNNLVQQSQNIKTQFDDLVNEETDIDNMIAQLDASATPQEPTTL